jgi:glycosyltransferase involved in cell wall biosynthesis
MIRLAESPELRESMGRAAIHRVESGTYDWDRKIDRFLEIYAETIARKASKSPRSEVAASPVASGR